jgi:hypothetical protein
VNSVVLPDRAGRRGLADRHGQGPHPERSQPAAALAQMTERYIEHMHSNEPVHTWPIGS